MNAKSVFILKLLLPVALAALLLTAIFWNRRPGATAGAVGEKGVSAPEQSESVPTPIPQPFPTTPPDAGKITVSDANDEGYATVIGVAGAVDPSSTVAVMNLSAHTMMTTTADAGGAFSLDLYAPHGSSLLIKYEPGGFRISHFWKLAITSLADSTTENLNPLPGTNLHVGQPPLGDGKSQRFSAVGDWRSTTPQGWAGWQLSGTLQVPASGTPAGL